MTGQLQFALLLSLNVKQVKRQQQFCIVLRIKVVEVGADVTGGPDDPMY